MVIYQGCLLLLLFDVINFILFRLLFTLFFCCSKAVKHHGAAKMWKNLHDEAKKWNENCFRSFTLKMCRKTEKDRWFLHKLSIFWWTFSSLMYFIILKRINTIGLLFFFRLLLLFSVVFGPSFEMPRNQQDDFLHFKQCPKKLYFRFVFNVSNYKVSVNFFHFIFFRSRLWAIFHILVKQEWTEIAACFNFEEFDLFWFECWHFEVYIL